MTEGHRVISLKGELVPVENVPALQGHTDELEIEKLELIEAAVRHNVTVVQFVHGVLSVSSKSREEVLFPEL